jgi:RluA family pseudouridine synthase
LCKHYKHFSRNQIQNLIDDGRVSIAGKRLKASTTLRPGESLRVTTKVAETREPDVELNYKILFEDDDVLVVDKPGNLPVHPAGKFLFNTLLMHLRRERASWVEKGNDFFLIHRLDRETSGVLLLAKNSATAGLLVKQFRERKTEKKYYAIATGHLPQSEMVVDADIGSAQGSEIRLKMAAYPKGTSEMDALTIFRVAERGRDCDLVDCELKTGRQHQIRVHLEYIGHPVVGDKLYGQRDEVFLNFIHKRRLTEEDQRRFVIDRHALHSRYLRFFHEAAGKWLEIESPLPMDMRSLLSQESTRGDLDVD